MAESGIPPEPVLEVPAPHEIKILETAEDIQVIFQIFYLFRQSLFFFSFIFK
uniref:Uncharacterized protein n=1 Tax=Parascaris equorum TaxID=6256 RepID=A0A914RLT1_PAREQ